MKKIPARIHIILAKKANYGIIIRRGPSKQVCTIGWDIKTNKFQLGQWLKGRIYERRCDISPDGKYFIYFAMNGKWNSSSKGSWTAISKAPYLKALNFYPKGDCWNGGGIFLGRKLFWLNDGYGHEIKRESVKRLQRSHTFPWKETYGGECPGVYYIRLQKKEGWNLVKRTNETSENIAVFEKTLKRGTLRKICHETIDHPMGKGCYYDEHEIVDENHKITLNLHDWEWTDVIDSRIFWVINGCLYEGQLNQNYKIVSAQMVKDFNDMKFEEIIAPY